MLQFMLNWSILWRKESPVFLPDN